ncbi:MAG: RNA polymerase sigma factor [Planctomycetales bacterium]|nr:RNA polymerase sigma factor [Planctomycetales bacterium]
MIVPQGPSADMATRSDEALAALAAREVSDGPAFNELLARMKQPVWRVCYRLLGNEDDARDAAQEVFLKMFTCRAQFAQQSKYSTWVHGIALRTCLHLRRGRGRRQQRIVTAEPHTMETQATASGAPAQQTGMQLDLRAMLEALDEEDRAMLILKYAEEYRFEDLAELFGISLSACKMRVSRAREKLKQLYPDVMLDA